MKTGEGEESPSVASSSARERGKREGERERGKEREREEKKKRAFEFGHKQKPLTNVFFFFLGEKAPPFGWISDLPAMTVPESPSLLLRFLDRATGFRRKRPPPSVDDLVVSFRAVSSLFSPSFFSSALEPNEISLEIQIRERETFTRDTRERHKLRFLAYKKKRSCAHLLYLGSSLSRFRSCPKTPPRA